MAQQLLEACHHGNSTDFSCNLLIVLKGHNIPAIIDHLTEDLIITDNSAGLYPEIYSTIEKSKPSKMPIWGFPL